MNTNTHLGQTMDNAGTAIRLDHNAKEVLADKAILAEIIHELIPGFENIPVGEVPEYISTPPEVGQRPVHPGQTNTGAIRGLGQESSFTGEGKALFDVFFQLRVPGANGETADVYVNIEAQATEAKSYTMEQRAVYYMARLISSQYERDFTKSEYEKLKKVYSIWIIFDPKTEYADSISTFSYRMRALHGKPKDDGSYDLSQAFIVRLSENAGPDTSNRLMGLLSTIFSEKVRQQDKKDILNRIYGVPVSQELERSVGEMCNYSEYILNRGLEQGVVKGRAEGREEGRISMITDLYFSGDITKAKAQSVLGMTGEEFDALLRNVKKEEEAPTN